MRKILAVLAAGGFACTSPVALDAPVENAAAFSISCGKGQQGNVCNFTSDVGLVGRFYFSDWPSTSYLEGVSVQRGMSTHDPADLSPGYTTVVRHVVGTEETVGFVRCGANFHCREAQK
jgi:hypothetical protein